VSALKIARAEYGIKANTAAKALVEFDALLSALGICEVPR
jgi:hypothetical protein